MADQPLVSVVLPTYNRAHCLPYAIESVLNQTHTNLELIVVDDNSSDGTGDIVQSIRDPRVKYIRNDPNLKLPRALNRGFSISQGEYLTWTSDDNLYAKPAIERMVQALRNNNRDFVYTDYFLFSEQDADGRAVDPFHERLPDKLQLEKGNHIGACFLYTRNVYEAIGDYDPELFLVEDYDYWMRIAAHFQMYHIAEPLYFFRRDDATLYRSRFSEVKSADLLVRYKNGLLNDDALLDTVISMLLTDMEKLNNPLFVRSYHVFRSLSWRLTKKHRDFTGKYLRRRLQREVLELLTLYRSKKIVFEEAKHKLREAMTRFGRIEYRPPKHEKRA